jgi:hypothetical protein
LRKRSLEKESEDRRQERDAYQTIIMKVVEKRPKCMREICRSRSIEEELKVEAQ